VPGTERQQASEQRAFLFLQGPSSPFFSRIADGLEALGHRAYRINLSVGDWLFWRRGGATNYRGHLADWPQFIAAFLDRHGITDLLLIGEQRDYHKQAIAAAKARGIQVTVTDFGYLRPDWITFERDGMSGCSHFPRDPESIRRLAADLPAADLTRRYQDSFWAMAVRDMADNLSTYLLGWLYPHYRSTLRLVNPLLMYLGVAKRLLFGKRNQRYAERLLQALHDADKAYFVYPLQVAYDFQIRAYSDFASQEQAIEQVVRSFAGHANAEAVLLVKVHPLDPGTTSWPRLIEPLAQQWGVADRVHYIDGGNLDQMCMTARGMVTINSTSGVSALQHDCPVITLGQAVYDVPGLTFQDGLDAFWQHCAVPDSQLRDAFINLMAASIQIRGVYYSRPGLDAAVAEAVERLQENRVNAPLPTPDPAQPCQ
jgi:capsular polysaccharide export protein